MVLAECDLAIARRPACRKELPNVGLDHAGHGAWLFRVDHRLRVRLRSAVKESAMIFDYSLAALVTMGLLIYLTYALLRPERF